MKNKLVYTLSDDISFHLQDVKFMKEWQRSKPAYQLACKLIEKRLARKMSQRSLAKKVKTSQAMISQIETMQANPTLSLMERLAVALDANLQISLS